MINFIFSLLFLLFTSFFIFLYLTFSQNNTFHMFYRFNQWQLFQQLLDFPEYMVKWEWHLVFRGGHLPCDFSGITTHISPCSPLSKCSYFHLPFGKCICGYAPKNVGRNCRETDVKVLKGKAADLMDAVDIGYWFDSLLLRKFRSCSSEFESLDKGNKHGRESWERNTVKLMLHIREINFLFGRKCGNLDNIC